jgi:hypothetical protein
MITTAAAAYPDPDIICFTCINALIPNANAIRPVPIPINMLDRLSTSPASVTIHDIVTTMHRGFGNRSHRKTAKPN